VRFGCLLVDIPWEFELWGRDTGSRSAESHYRTHGTDWACDLPISDIAAKDATLLLWTTNPHLPDGFRVLAAWGFRYVTTITWVKMARAACPRIGLGYHARGATEQLLIGQRGNAPAPPTHRRPPSVIFCPRGAHSAKPDFQYEIAEGYPGPYLEVFSRRRREGWENVGDHLDGLDIRESLRRLAADEPLPRLPLAQPALDWQPQP
jgi:N6-adenosine-specific RNA methylase IME4